MHTFYLFYLPCRRSLNKVCSCVLCSVFKKSQKQFFIFLSHLTLLFIYSTKLKLHISERILNSQESNIWTLNIVKIEWYHVLETQYSIDIRWIFPPLQILHLIRSILWLSWRTGMGLFVHSHLLLFAMAQGMNQECMSSHLPWNETCAVSSLEACSSESHAKSFECLLIVFAFAFWATKDCPYIKYKVL